MSVSSLLETVLAREQRSEELEAERDDKFQTWVKRLNTESKVFLTRINELDLSEREDRQAFYGLVAKMKPRFDQLRERDEIGEVPTAVVIELDELNAKLAGVSPPVRVSTTLIGPDSVTKTSSEERQDREQQEYATKTAESLAKQLRSVYDALPNDE